MFDWTQPLDILSADSEFVCYYLSKKGAWATQPLGQILDSEFLLCEQGVARASASEGIGPVWKQASPPYPDWKLSTVLYDDNTTTTTNNNHNNK